MNASGDSTPEAGTPGANKKNPLLHWGVPFAVVGAGVAGVIAVANSSDPAARAAEERRVREQMAEAMGGVYGQPTEAASACEQFVSERLKAPSTAEFTAVQTDTAGDAWQVRGGVDARNSLGAQIRTQYVCTVRGDAGGGYSLVSLDIE